MEGDGPIMGTPAASGVLVMGTNLPAVDATAARLMGIDPARVAYLAAASGRLGPIAERHIAQRGEPIAPLVAAVPAPRSPQLRRPPLLTSASPIATPRSGVEPGLTAVGDSGPHLPGFRPWPVLPSGRQAVGWFHRPGNAGRVGRTTGTSS